MNLNNASSTCELLRELPACQRPRPQPGYTFTHLGPCQGQRPLVWGDEEEDLTIGDGFEWKWSLMGSIGSDYSVPDDGQSPRYPSNAFHMGLYYPGWYSPTQLQKHRIITSERTKKACDEGHILTVRNDVNFTWVPYVTGSAVPRNALQVASWTGGLPLYLVKKDMEGVIVYSYYVLGYPDVAFVQGGIVTATDVYMLTQ